MTFRTQSRGQQWAVWSFVFVVALAIYVVLSHVLYGSVNWNVLAPLQQRIALPLLAFVYLIASETRWDGIRRKSRRKKGGERREDEGVERAEEKTACRHAPEPSAVQPVPSSYAAPPAPGEAEYAAARAMPHQPIPDSQHDGEYMKLLAKSAELGYPRALAKLGEYAIRRGWTVEAYYWLWRAKRAGMEGLDRTLLQVRGAWASGGFHRESANEYECFDHGRGKVGYALLCIDARYNAEAAKARLAECAPEFLSVS